MPLRKMLYLSFVLCVLLEIDVVFSIDAVRETGNAQLDNLKTPLYCYTCMSENIPITSKRVMKETINLPEYAESRMCSGPFPLDSRTGTDNKVKLEPCNSACVKVLSENKYLKLVIRGCLDKLYAITPDGGPSDFVEPDATDRFWENCDRQKHESAGIGDTITDTCLCMSSYCNSVEKRTTLSNALFVLALFAYALLAHMLA